MRFLSGGIEPTASNLFTKAAHDGLANATRTPNMDRAESVFRVSVNGVPSVMHSAVSCRRILVFVKPYWEFPSMWTVLKIFRVDVHPGRAPYGPFSCLATRPVCQIPGSQGSQSKAATHLWNPIDVRTLLPLDLQVSFPSREASVMQRLNFYVRNWLSSILRIVAKSWRFHDRYLLCEIKVVTGTGPAST